MDGVSKKVRAQGMNVVMRTTELSASHYPNISYVRIDQDYWDRQDVSQLCRMLFLLETIRQFESRLLDLDDQGLVHGPLHSSIGQEAVAVGAALGLKRSDKVISTHRAHHHFLAKALLYYATPEFDPLTTRPNEELRACARKTLAEIVGLSPGWVGGRGGSMHLFDRQSGNFGSNAIVGGGIPIASGVAFAEKFRGTGNVALCVLGDGAVSIGSFHEGINMAVVYNLPAIFVIENNLYAVATNNMESTGTTDLAIRAAGFNMPGLIVNGMDPLAMKQAVELAREHASSASGPVLIEAKTYRYRHHSGALPGSVYGYRTKEEENLWQRRDSLATWPRELERRGILNRRQSERIAALAGELVNDALRYCTEATGKGTYTIKPELWPATNTALTGVRSNGQEFEGVTFKSLADYSETRSIKMVQAVSEVLARRMESDPGVFVLGEEVGHLRGGVYGATKDALASFADRLYDTPISEAGFTGLACGAAIAGLKPVVEIMFPDFALEAAGQLFNQIARLRHVYGGGVALPLIVRTRCSIGRGFGGQHSGDPVGLFALYPGWRIVAPSTPFDYIGFFNAAVLSRDPVLIIEHHEPWQIEGPVPVDDMDYLVPMGQAEIRRSGSDVTVLAYLSLVARVLRIAEELADEGISAEVIDLRTLDHANVDFASISQSVKKTGSLVMVEQAMASQSLGPFIAARVQERCLDYLDYPITLVSSRDIHPPVSKPLEEFCLISDDQVRQAILAASHRVGC